MEHPEPRRQPGGSSVSDLSEDALGFGRLEFATAWQLLKNPREALDAWMTTGSTGGGRFARPLRFYLTLNAVLMLYLFFNGGAEGLLVASIPADVVDPLITASGKSRDAFMADADGWITLILVPIFAACYAVAIAPLLRWWDPDDLGWRRSFRAAFAYLCAWTVQMLFIAWFNPGNDLGGMILNATFVVLGIVTFLRMGSGRWFRSPLTGLCKALVAAVAIQVGAASAAVPVFGIGLIAGRFF